MALELTAKGKGRTISLFSNFVRKTVTLTDKTPQSILQKLVGTDLVQEKQTKAKKE